jgi:hypothetical protein
MGPPKRVMGMQPFLTTFIASITEDRANIANDFLFMHRQKEKVCIQFCMYIIY